MPGHLELIIGQNLKVEVVFVGKFLVRGDRIDADPEDCGVEVLNGDDVVPEGAGLFGAAGGIVFGIKIRTTHFPRNAERVTGFPS